MLDIYQGDNLEILSLFPNGHFDLIYTDPPFNTGKVQKREMLQMIRDEENGNRLGYQGQRYRTISLGSREYRDVFDSYMDFLIPRLEEAYRVLSPTGSFLLHLDYREVHYAKIALDLIFGRECFQNEIIWAYDYGARSRKRWPTKHDTILWFSKDPEKYTFQYEEMDRIPYMAPGLVGNKKAAEGKTPTDTWWHTIVSPTGKEKTGYPNQKPLGILNRLVRVHSKPGDKLLDFFAGSGSWGEAAWKNGREEIVLIDNNPQAIETMLGRLSFASPHLNPPLSESREVELVLA